MMKLHNTVLCSLIFFGFGVIVSTSCRSQQPTTKSQTVSEKGATPSQSKETGKQQKNKGSTVTEQNKTDKSTTVTLKSGLTYKVLEKAEKEQISPQRGDIVSVHYTGWLDNQGNKGKKFDSSVDRGQAFTFTLGVGQVIKGWDEMVAEMHVGQKVLCTIPSQLGYGTRGAGNAIPGGATLIFEIELLDILPRK